MASTTWKGYISFGLVSIPINLTPAARTERISFNQLHKVCHSRLKQPLFCPTCNRMVERQEVEKGYEYDKDQYLLFTEEELKQIEPDSARSMEILEFVKLSEIDPLFFDASYYVLPEQAGVHAYRLLLEAMLGSGYAAIAKLTMHNRENIVVIRARKEGLTLHTMFYSSEVRPAGESGSTDKGEVKEQERALALQLIESLAAPFQAEKYHDNYQEGLRTLIAAKKTGQQVVAAPQVARAPVIDLMAALKKSLDQKPRPSAENKTLLRTVPKKEEAPRRRRRAG
jgi:DNA end-binding protein Ku